MVKNFPTEQELIACAGDFGREIVYRAPTVLLASLGGGRPSLRATRSAWRGPSRG